MGIKRMSQEKTFHRRYAMESFKYWSMTSEEVLEYMKSDRQGLSQEESEERIKKYGENVIRKKKQVTQFMLFANQFRNPIVVILIIATLISGITGDWTDAFIIFLIVLASAVLSFTQEYSAGNAIEALRSKVQAKAVAVRDGKEVEIFSRNAVPGDIIRLSG